MLRFGFLLFLLSFLAHQAQSQTDYLDQAISRHRKGQLLITAPAGANVQVTQLAHEFWFGAAIANGLGSGSMDPDDRRRYSARFLENFNSAVTENALKWANMEPEKGKVNHQTVEGILAWTEENNLPLRGHNLFWGIEKFVQPWVKELSDDELERTIRERAISIARRYKGRFAEYDLNNEMIHGNYYEERLGPGITGKMVGWVLEGDPDAKLYLNDYDILTGNRLEDYLRQIRDLLAQGLPIAGIGVQGHLHGSSFDRMALQASLDSLAQFGLPIRITEFNMPGQRSKFYRDTQLPMTAEEEAHNAQELVDYYRICFAHPAVEGILMWGFWEGVNWIPASSLYTRDWQARPAANAYQNLVFGQWWTKAERRFNAQETWELPAFFGQYRITVNGKSQDVELSKEAGLLRIDLTQ